MAFPTATPPADRTVPPVSPNPGPKTSRVAHACTIMKPAAKLHAFWRRLENLPQVMKDSVVVTSIGGKNSHWSVSAPVTGQRLEWTAVITRDEPGRLIAWRSLDEADIANSGTIRFDPAPGGDGTEVTVELEYNPPGGKLADFFSRISEDAPKRQVVETLRRFKALMEAGEIPTTAGQSVGEPQRSRLKKEAAP